MKIPPLNNYEAILKHHYVSVSVSLSELLEYGRYSSSISYLFYLSDNFKDTINEK